MHRLAWLVALLPACVVGQEPDAPEDPEQRAIEHVLSTPAPAPRVEAAVVALPSRFPWLGDLLPADDADALFGRFLVRLQQDDPQAWRAAALELLRDAPTSPGIPYVYLAFAETSLDAGRPDHAVQFLERVLTFDDPHARTFAFHDLGWAHMQSSPPDHAKALGAFMNAITESQRPDPKLARSGAALRLAARRDLVTAYAAVGDPAKAKDFFTRVGRGPGNEDAVAEMLALLEAAKK